MKATLKPEEERMVTPGARAVEDLNLLPSMEDLDFLYLDEVATKTHDGQTIDSYQRLGIQGTNVSVADVLGEIRTNMPPSQAQGYCTSQGGLLPSLPLFMHFLDRISRIDGPRATEFLEGILVKEQIVTNTVVHRKQIVHYPCLHDLTKVSTDRTRRIYVPALGHHNLSMQGANDHPNFQDYITSLTGMHPDALIKLGERLNTNIVMGPVCIANRKYANMHISTASDASYLFFGAMPANRDWGHVRMVKE